MKYDIFGRDMIQENREHIMSEDGFWGGNKITYEPTHFCCYSKSWLVVRVQWTSQIPYYVYILTMTRMRFVRLQVPREC